MCFSHANRLPFRLTCLAGGVERSCLCQRVVFVSLISRVMFPSTSFWGKRWRFGAPIAFSASTGLFQMLPFAYWFQVSLSFFDLTNYVPVVSFVWFSGSSEKLEMRGIDPRTSGMQSERSTICATSPLRKRGAYDIWSLSLVNAIVERSLLLHFGLNLASSLQVINPCVSHMPTACTFDWDALLVVSKGAIYFIRRSLILFWAE